MTLPNFIIMGERRSGSTSLARLVNTHRQVYLHPRLDMAYFIDEVVQHRKDLCKGRVRPEEWDATHNPKDYASRFTGVWNESAIGEKSADYLFWALAHARIKAFCPDVKLIITLRDPVERAWSHYLGEVGKGRETLSFEDAIEAEPERIAASDYCKDHLSYVTRGFYDLSISKLLETFDRSHVHILTLDEMKLAPLDTLNALFDFLEVDRCSDLKQPVLSQNRNWTTFPNEFIRRRRALRLAEAGFVWACRKGFKYTVRDHYRRTQIQVRFESIFRKTKADLEMNQGTRQRLVELYDPHMEAVEQLVGKDLGQWRKRC